MLPFDGGTHSNNRLFSDYASNNQLFGKWYMLVIEVYIEVSLLKWLISGNNYLTFYNNKEHKCSFGDM